MRCSPRRSMTMQGSGARPDLDARWLPRTPGSVWPVPTAGPQAEPVYSLTEKWANPDPAPTQHHRLLSGPDDTPDPFARRGAMTTAPAVSTALAFRRPFACVARDTQAVSRAATTAEEPPPRLDWVGEGGGACVILNTDMLMTAVFAAVAAVFAGGANAAIGTAMATQAVATAPRSRAATGSIRQSERQWRPGRSRQRPRLRAATSSVGNRHGNGDPGGSDARSRVGHAQRRAAGPAGRAGARLQTARHIFPDTSDVVSRYLGNDRIGTVPFPDGYRSPDRATSREKTGRCRPSSRR